MAKITIDNLSTYDLNPLITGTVEFERFDSLGNPKQTFQIVINYMTYKLFVGNLGVNEKVTPNIWKLKINTQLYYGTYEVEAQIIDIATNRVVESATKNIIIQRPPQRNSYIQPKNLSLYQKFMAVNMLMGALDRMFGGKSGIKPIPSVHPVRDDQASTTEIARGKEESPQHPVPKSREQTSKGNNGTVAKKDPHKATSSGGGGGGGGSGEPASTMTEAQRAELAWKSRGGELADDGTLKAPEELGGDGTNAQQAMDQLAEVQQKQDEINNYYNNEASQQIADSEVGAYVTSEISNEMAKLNAPPDLAAELINNNPGDQTVTPSSPLG